MSVVPKVSQQTKDKYDLLAKLEVNVLSHTDSEAKVDIGKWNCQNALRQMVEYKEAKKEDVPYDTKDSKYEHHLLKVSAQKSNRVFLNVKLVLNKLFDMGNPTQLVDSMLEYLLDHHKKRLPMCFKKSASSQKL